MPHSGKRSILTLRIRGEVVPGRDMLAVGLLSFFGVGFIPWAPGTFGSIAALLILALPFPPEYMPTILLMAIAAGTGASLYFLQGRELEWGNDPSHVVLDEAIGIWIVLLSGFFIPERHKLFFFAAGFLIFRFFDILKPYPISRLNDREGPFYVLADDIAAALLSALLLLGSYYMLLSLQLIS